MKRDKIAADKNAFLKAHPLFGTDGIRSKAGKYPLTKEAVFRLGRAVGLWLLDSKYKRNGCRWQAPTQKSAATVVIGCDTRASGPLLEDALARGIASCAIDVTKIGVITTAGLAYVTKKAGARLGAMISASHNPACDNGIKFFTSGGFKLSDTEEGQIENIFDKNESPKLKGINLAAIRTDKGLAAAYMDFLKKISNSLKMLDMKIVIDCSNGAASFIAPAIFKDISKKVIVIQNKPNGKNINLGCGSLHPELISRYVLKEKADIGISFDGDGDRVIFCDADGVIRDGDFIMAVVMNDAISNNGSGWKAVVATHMSNVGFDLAMKQRGIKVIKAEVGDRYVMDKMLKENINFGGEQSGHIIFLSHTTTGDGLVTALEILRIINKSGKSLKELSECMRKFPQVLVNVQVNEKPPIESLPEVRKAIANGYRRLGGEGRIFVRYSGTQNLARVMVEGKSEEEIKYIADNIAKNF